MPQIFYCEESTGPGPRGDMICPVCHDEFEPDTKNITHTRCRTTFCQECLYTWVTQKAKGEFATCPIDRDIIGVGEREETEDGSEGEFDLPEPDNPVVDEDDDDGDDEAEEDEMLDGTDWIGDQMMFDSIEGDLIGLAIQTPNEQSDNEDNFNQAGDGIEEAAMHSRRRRGALVPDTALNPTIPASTASSQNEQLNPAVTMNDNIAIRGDPNISRVAVDE